MDQEHANLIDKEIAELRQYIASVRKEVAALYSRMHQSDQDLKRAWQAIADSRAAIERLDQIRAVHAPTSTVPDTADLLIEPNEGGAAPT